MLSSLFRPRKGRKRIDRSPFASPYGSPTLNRHGDAAEERNEQQHRDGDYNEDDGDYSTPDDEDEPLLPIFSTAYLGMSAHIPDRQSPLTFSSQTSSPSTT